MAEDVFPQEREAILKAMAGLEYRMNRRIAELEANVEKVMLAQRAQVRSASVIWAGSLVAAVEVFRELIPILRILVTA